MVNGNNVVFATATTSDGTKLPIGMADSVSMSTSHAVIDTTTKDSASNSQFIAGRLTHTLSGSGLWDLTDSTTSTQTDDLYDLVLARTQIFFSFGEGNNIYEGSGYFTEAGFEAPSDDKVTYNWSFQVTGAVTKNFS